MAMPDCLRHITRSLKAQSVSGREKQLRRYLRMMARHYMGNETIFEIVKLCLVFSVGKELVSEGLCYGRVS